MVADVFEPALGYSIARHLQPGVCGAGSGRDGKGLVAWVSSIARLTAGEVVAIDGKALCGTRDTGKKTLVHMASAWAESNGLVLAQRKVEEKSNEITAIPKLLEALECVGPEPNTRNTFAPCVSRVCCQMIQSFELLRWVDREATYSPCPSDRREDGAE